MGFFPDFCCVIFGPFWSQYDRARRDWSHHDRAFRNNLEDLLPFWKANPRGLAWGWSVLSLLIGRISKTSSASFRKPNVSVTSPRFPFRFVSERLFCRWELR